MTTPKKYNLATNFWLSNNIAEDLSDEVLDELGSSLKKNIDIDINSRSDWLKRNDKWLELVTQVMEEKTSPWPNASNIKFPLISTAAVQFHARAFPALLGSNKPVKGRVIGRDPKGLKAQRASRVSTFMSYQVTEDMDGWVDDQDRLLFLVPIIGSLYKKTYHNPAKGKNVSELIHPRDFIINYDALDLSEARKTHRIWKLPNTIKEMQNRFIYREFEGSNTIEPTKTHSEPKDKIHGLNNPGISDDYSLQELYETHCLLDLDEDGYSEPYVVTLRASDGKIFRLVANYDNSTIERSETGGIVAIAPKDYFTHYFFLPDPESKTHGIGLGTMVGPINEAVNTLVNQLTDAGTLSNLQVGFLSRGIRTKGGAVKFKPGEWKTVNTTGDDLKKGIFPMPVREPSNVLFQLLGLLIESGKDLTSVQDIMVGRNPGQNQPYRTSQAVIEQGMKVFNGIYKRLYRSMTAEFKKLYRLNREHPDVELYKQVLDLDGQEVGEASDIFSEEAVNKFLAEDFDAENIDILPTAEPDMVAEIEKITKANSLLEKAANGMRLNMGEVTKRILEAEGHEDITTLMTVEPPPPPPEIMLKDKELKHRIQVDGLDGKLKELKTQAEVLNLNVDSELKLAKAKNESVEGLHTQYMQEQQLIKDEFEAVTKRLKVMLDGNKTRESGEQTEGATSAG